MTEGSSEVLEETAVDHKNSGRGPGRAEIPSSFTLKVLYLFAGAERKTSVVECLRRLTKDAGWELEAHEIDLKRGKGFDLTQERLQSKILSDIAAGLFHCVICTPPCSTWTRVRMANRRGPPPLRSKEHPWGYPWVKRRFQHELDLGNELVRFSIEVWAAVDKHPQSVDGLPVFLFGEHPEDLGQVKREEDGMQLNPASIWQLEEIRRLVDKQGPVQTVAINQCCWGAPWRKPTRLVTTAVSVQAWGPCQWPVMDEDNVYQGPLERNCQCKVTMSLARKEEDEGFRTSGTDVYPPKLDLGIAEALMSHIQTALDASSKEGEGESSKEADTEEVSTRKDCKDDTKKERVTKIPVEEEYRNQEKGVPVYEDTGFRGTAKRPIKCYYKGHHRTIHDGGGLNSPGRWPVKERKEVASEEGKSISSECKRLFLEWIRGNDGEEGVKGCFWKMAAGKAQESPFAEVIEGFRERLDLALERMGFNPRRRPNDRESEVNFRRLKCMLEAVGDVDHSWLEEVAEEGVCLGVDEELPRVPEVFEEKEKWNLSFTEEDFRDTLADNYKSAEENSVDIARQVAEEVERGSIIMMSLKEAEKKYAGRLAIAALGAVPKEQGSNVVRIVHDGSYSVDVNHRIKVRDRMRFPTVDDAAGVLMHLEDQAEEEKGLVRFSMLYDVARAHKLLPVKEKDWGLQAFRLPGKEEEMKEEVFLHTRGTFGIASAAYWWQRLAAGVVRLGHVLAGVELGILHLLFADDGWMVATGGFFWRKLLFWLFILDLLEIPLSWKKVRGGVKVQWIGYQIDVQMFEKGISSGKVKWVEEWISSHLISEGVVGRDLRSALGRFGFVAGALHHVRPFLGPLFAWSAVLAPGTFAKFPEAIRILLEYVKMQISLESMCKPRRVKERSREAFRVDAKAEGECIVIGGWEIPRGSSNEKERWFSIRLNRRNAPWAYMKGEPFRNIASLELTAVLVAVILFGDNLVDDEGISTLTLSASTDNLGNTYVLQHFMSCKYPLSIVVMELAMQLKKCNLELDLGWVPRDQNTEADALTNSDFSGFLPEKRIERNFEDIQFEVLDKLVEKAGELDKDIRLAKSSKELKGDRPEETIRKRKRGQTRWEDPW